MLQRSFPTILADDLPAVRDFYTSLFGWEVGYDSDWFVSMQAPSSELLELGVLKRDHELVPGRFRTAGNAMVVLVVDDVDALHEKAKAAGHEVVEPPRDLFYGQRRMLLVDPAGTMVDVSSECPPSPEFLASMQS